MVKIVITNKVMSHHTNNDYNCVLVQFEPGDSHFKPIRQNWMPKDSEVLELLEAMMNLSPTFRKGFAVFVRDKFPAYEVSKPGDEKQVTLEEAQSYPLQSEIDEVKGKLPEDVTLRYAKSEQEATGDELVV